MQGNYGGGLDIYIVGAILYLLNRNRAFRHNSPRERAHNMISKDEAIYKLTVAHIEMRMHWQLWLDTSAPELDKTTHGNYKGSESKYNALKQAYIDCGLVSYDDTYKLQETYGISKANKG